MGQLSEEKERQFQEPAPGHDSAAAVGVHRAALVGARPGAGRRLSVGIHLAPCLRDSLVPAVRLTGQRAEPPSDPFPDFGKIRNLQTGEAPARGMSGTGGVQGDESDDGESTKRLPVHAKSPLPGPSRAVLHGSTGAVLWKSGTCSRKPGQDRRRVFRHRLTVPIEGTAVWLSAYETADEGATLVGGRDLQLSSGTCSSSYFSTRTPMPSIKEARGFISSSPTTSIRASSI